MKRIETVDFGQAWNDFSCNDFKLLTPHSALPGCPLQHLLYHRPGRFRPGLALLGGRRCDVHPRIRRLHRRPARKLLPAQICAFTHRALGLFQSSLSLATTFVKLCECFFFFLSFSSLCSWVSSSSWSWLQESWPLSSRTGSRTSSTSSLTTTFGPTEMTLIFRTW